MSEFTSDSLQGVDELSWAGAEEAAAAADAEGDALSDEECLEILNDYLTSHGRQATTLEAMLK
ncbi:hypothetical protein AGMMS49991_07800 [Spirochaetia bacterium]|nr:hypothetical protein AGMMS49991_07800 [Spirochaetia bacterium]